MILAQLHEKKAYNQIYYHWLHLVAEWLLAEVLMVKWGVGSRLELGKSEDMDMGHQDPGHEHIERRVLAAWVQDSLYTGNRWRGPEFLQFHRHQLTSP